MFALQIIPALLYFCPLSLTFAAHGFDMLSATQPPASFVCKDTEYEQSHWYVTPFASKSAKVFYLIKTLTA